MTPPVSVSVTDKGHHVEGACEVCTPAIDILLSVINRQAETIGKHQKALDLTVKQVKALGGEPDSRAEALRTGVWCAPWPLSFDLEETA